MKFSTSQILTIVFMLFAFACSRTSGNSSSQQDIADVPPPTVGVNECLFEGEIENIAEGIASIRVERIIDKGSSFRGDLYVGQTIKLTNLSFESGVHLFLVESSDGPDGPKFSLLKEQ